MDTTHSTPQLPEKPAQTINSALNLRWRYFKSANGQLLAACFDSAVLENNPHFIGIDEFEYRHLLKEMQS